ncbi:hypothetical protein HED60_06205 [Planctomycetales bacterium ZRK34]|nr:hypothetical protein HED60_06205 [Planctomycetales bacterium ZRK34]
MNRPARHSDDALADLMAGVLDGSLSDADEKALADQLMQSPELRQQYLAHLELHGMLRWSLLRDTRALSTRPTTAPTPTLWRLPGSRSVWYAAALLLLAVTIAAALLMTSRPPSAIHHQPSQPVALLSNTDHASWGDSTVPTALGSELSRGTLNLRSGSAQVMFSSGAVVDIIGPCTLHMVGPNEARLDHGRLAAYVPQQARGFTVNAANVSVVDLGTRFYMLAHSASLTTVGVDTGHVQLVAGDIRRTLAAGDIVAVSGESDSDRTLDVALGLANSARLLWNFDTYEATGLDIAAPAQLVRNDLLGFAPAPAGGQLADGNALRFAPEVVERQDDGAGIVACAGLLIPQAARGGSQTLLTRFFWAGYADDNPEAKMGWIINNGLRGAPGAAAGGGWLLGIRHDALSLHMTTPAGSFDSERLTLTPGRWYDVAAVFDDRGDADPANDTITLYLRPAGQQQLASHTAPRPVPAEANPSLMIGGESLGVGDKNHRKAFRGSIDYIALWDRALTESQLQSLIDARP